MQIRITNINDTALAELISDQVEIKNTQDAVELIGNCLYRDAHNILIHESHLAPGFFDLSTGIAGDMLQKFSTYNARLAIVGDFSKYDSKSLKDFIRESNRAGRINFAGSMEQAEQALLKK